MEPQKRVKQMLNAARDLPIVAALIALVLIVLDLHIRGQRQQRPE